MEPQPSPAAFNPQLRRRLLWGLLGLLVVVGLVDWWFQRHKEKRFDSAIVTAARQAGVEPALVKAIVWRESKFNPKVRGRVGEIGLMQIRSLTAQEWAQSVRKERGFEGNLFEPATNLQIGSWYISKLLRRYARTDRPVCYALADYNAGRNNVLRWAKGRAETNAAAFVAQITFPSTQDYVRSIIQRAEKYRALNRQLSAAGSDPKPAGSLLPRPSSATALMAQGSPDR